MYKQNSSGQVQVQVHVKVLFYSVAGAINININTFFYGVLPLGRVGDSWVVVGGWWEGVGGRWAGGGRAVGCWGGMDGRWAVTIMKKKMKMIAEMGDDQEKSGGGR